MKEEDWSSADDTKEYEATAQQISDTSLQEKILNCEGTIRYGSNHEFHITTKMGSFKIKTGSCIFTNSCILESAPIFEEWSKDIKFVECGLGIIKDKFGSGIKVKLY